MNEWVQLMAGAGLLYVGGEWLVGGASALALALRVPQLLVGLTVVAYGTSAPELVVGVHAASTGHAQVAFGNVIGSNIANIGLILGLAAMVQPARVDGVIRRRELPVLLGTTFLVPALLVDGRVSRMEGLALVSVALAYTMWMVRVARASSVLVAARVDASATTEAADIAGAPRPIGILRSLATATAGLGMVLVGGDVFVEGAVVAARTLGMSERLVGLTVVAVGTSLPELVTSVVAARRGHSDIAIGNVVGSNIFNLLLCLGAAAMAGPLSVELAANAWDLGALVLVTALAGAFLRDERTISRSEGAMALGVYVVFAVMTIALG